MESISQTKSSKDNFYFKFLIVFFTVLLCVTITIFATIHTKSSVDRIIHMNFDFRCKKIQSLVSERLEDHERLLLSGIGLFNSSKNVTRSEWNVFNKNQYLEKKLPGILGIGFSLVIPPKNLNMHIQQVRNEGFPEYNVKPSGNREMYTSIVYLEPFKGRNLRAFGYDMFSEKVRRTAMKQAIDTGSAALSGKVILLQETNKGVQAGTLMYLPLYSKGMPINTIKERRAAIYGWVYSPYRMDDLISGILGTKLIEQNPVVELKIFDGQNTLEKNLLYQEPTISKVSSYSGVSLTENLIVNFNGHHWSLIFSQKANSFFSKVYIFPWIILIGGTLITFMFLMLILSLLNTRATNEKLTKTNNELRESEEEIKNLSKFPSENTNPVLRVTNSGVLTYINESGRNIMGKDWNIEVGKNIPEPFIKLLKKSYNAGRTAKGEFNIGSKIFLFSITPIKDANYANVYGVDISIRKHSEMKLKNTAIELENAHEHALYMLAVASEFKDPETGGHIKRIVQLTTDIARELGIKPKRAERIGHDSILHDLGKLGISDYILLKPDKLSEIEYETMKQHTLIGAEIIGADDWFINARQIALFHHEKWNGSGYPEGLEGEAIPIAARIVAVADEFDALMSRRPYKEAWSIEKAIETIKKEAGTHFDPRIIEAFLSLHKKGMLKNYSYGKYHVNTT